MLTHTVRRWIELFKLFIKKIWRWRHKLSANQNRVSILRRGRDWLTQVMWSNGPTCYCLQIPMTSQALSQSDSPRNIARRTWLANPAFQIVLLKKYIYRWRRKLSTINMIKEGIQSISGHFDSVAWPKQTKCQQSLKNLITGMSWLPRSIHWRHLRLWQKECWKMAWWHPNVVTSARHNCIWSRKNGILSARCKRKHRIGFYLIATKF